MNAGSGRRLGIIGTGGVARDALSLIRAQVRADPAPGLTEADIVFVDRAAAPDLKGLPVLSQADFMALPGERLFVVAIGDGAARARVSDELEAAGCTPLSIRAETAHVAEDARIGPGAYFGPFSLIGVDTVIGRQFQCHNHAYVAHDCIIGDQVTLAPRAGLSGNVHVGNGAFIGAGAIVRPGTPDRPLTIGAGAIVGVGAVVMRDVPAGATVVGNPARPLVHP